MADSGLFLEAQHPVSGRHAVFEDDGTSAWLYLSETNSRRPVADVWIYNRVVAPPTSEIKNYQGGPPPAAIGYVTENAQCVSPNEYDWQFVWSHDGEAVAILKDAQPVAFVIARSKQGSSRELVKDGPWGNVWNHELFKQTLDDMP